MSILNEILDYRRRELEQMRDPKETPLTAKQLTRLTNWTQTTGMDCIGPDRKRHPIPPFKADVGDRIFGMKIVEAK